MPEEKLGEAHVIVEARLDKLEKDLAKAEKKTKKSTNLMSKGFDKLTTHIKKGALALAAFASIAGAIKLKNLVKDSLDVADAIDKTSSKLGITTKFLQEAEFAASQTGISFETMGTAMQRMARRAAEAAGGTGEAKDAFKELRVDVTNANGSLKDTETLFREVLAAAKDVPEQGDKLRLFMKIFDTEGVGLVNTANHFEELTAQASSLGIVLDQSLIDKAVEAKDKLDILARVAGNDMRGALIELAPMVIQVAKAFAELARLTAIAWAKFSDFLNLDPIGVTAIKDRLAEINDELIEEEETLGRLEKSATNARGKQRFGLVTRIKDIKETVTALKTEEAQLKKNLALIEAKSKPEEFEGVRKLNLSRTNPLEEVEVTAKALEALSKGRRNVIKVISDEGSQATEMWDDFSDEASSSFARMLADGDFTFKALAKSFIANFTQSIIQQNVLGPLLNLAGGFVSGLRGGSLSGAGGTDLPSLTSPGGGIQIASAGGGINRAVNLSVVNNSSSEVVPRVASNGDIELFIENAVSKNISNGGSVASTIESRFNVQPQAIRRG